MKITIHNITFRVRGKCKRCGACERKSCVHYSEVNGKATCAVYGKGDYLEWRCNEFPDSPFCDVVLKGICGFTFKPVSKEDQLRYEEYLKAWQLT